MLADRHSPLNAFAGPFSRNLKQSLRYANARGGQRQPSGIECGQCNLQPRAFFENHVLARDTNIGEPNDRIVKRPESHKPAAIRDFQSRRVHIDDEGCNLLAFLSADHLGRRPRHHHQHAGFHAIGAPKLFAVEHELGAVFAWLGFETQCRRIGSRMDFSQRERGNLPAGNAWKIFLFLLFGSKQKQRLRDTN